MLMCVNLAANDWNATSVTDEPSATLTSSWVQHIAHMDYKRRVSRCRSCGDVDRLIPIHRELAGGVRQSYRDRVLHEPIVAEIVRMIQPRYFGHSVYDGDWSCSELVYT